MPRATLDDIIQMLRREGASADEAARITDALVRAGLRPPQMRVWLDSPNDAHDVSVGLFLAPGVEWRQVPTHAVESGHVDAVIEAAEAFAAASSEDRWVCLTLGCHLDQAQRLTRGDPQRAAIVLDILTRLKRTFRKPSVIYEVVQQTLSGTWEDPTRLVDWMLDDRLADARDALATGRIDPVELRSQDTLNLIGW